MADENGFTLNFDAGPPTDERIKEAAAAISKAIDGLPAPEVMSALVAIVGSIIADRAPDISHGGIFVARAANDMMAIVQAVHYRPPGRPN